jgi:putative ABC transport system permease protein
MKRSTPHIWLIELIGIIVPRRLRTDWRQEWAAELQYREMLLAEWDRLNWKTKLDLWRRSLGAFSDALLLQPARMEDEVFQDLRYGMRMLLRRPAFTGLAMLTLALGIGVSMTLFTVVNSVLLRPLPYRDADRLVEVFETQPEKNISRYRVSLADFNDWRAHSDIFDDLAAITPSFDRRITGDGEPENVVVNEVTSNLFEMLGVRAALGRTFLPDDETPSSTPVVVLSYKYWVTRFGAEPAVIDSKIVLNEKPYTVVGVLPKDFRETFESIPGRAQLWVPVVWNERSLTRHGPGGALILGRLRNEITLSQARAEMASLAEGLSQAHPDTNSGIRAAVYELHDEVTRRSRETLVIFLVAALFVLLISCANVAGLILARNVERAREIAIRSALGAGPWRVVRQLLTENLLLALSGGALAIPLTWSLIAFIVLLIPSDLPRTDQITPDARTLLVTLLTSIGSAVLIGLTPSMHAAKVKLSEALKDSGYWASESGFSRFWRNTFVVSQIALTLVLLIGAGLIVNSLVRLYQVDPGFNTKNMLTMSVSLPRRRDEIPQRWNAFWNELLERTRALSGVQQAAAVAPLPLADTMYGTSVRLPAATNARPDEDLVVGYSIVSDGYFEMMGLRLLDGRFLAAVETAPTVVVNEAFALTYFPTRSAVGQTVVVDTRLKTQTPAEIVGVVSDTRARLDEPLRPQIYEPLSQFPSPSLYVVARTQNEPKPLAGSLRGLVFDLDKNQPVGTVRTMDEVLEEYGIAPRFYLTLLGGFALLALLLAITGIYGVLTYTVTRRTREIGIRLALGARQGDVLRLVAAQGAKLIVCGTAIGLLAAFGMTRLMRNLLFSVSPTDPLTFIGIASLLILIALPACWIPARRATRLDPLVALRHE